MCTHPVWSVGHHGPTDVLVEKLNPMLLKYKVAAYFSGHDHDMQHLNDSGVQYFLSGAGHLVESSQKHKVDHLTSKIKIRHNILLHK
jgi:tartrate-resistant acid phosphatase type 5